MVNGVGGMVLFASEYGILMASALNAMARYVLSILDLRRARARGGENAPPWEHKSMYIFYIELVTDFLKLSTYLTFFMIILTFYGLPLNIIRDVYLTARSFITRLRALIRYHNATRDMDRRYPDATEAETPAELPDMSPNRVGNKSAAEPSPCAGSSWSSSSAATAGRSTTSAQGGQAPVAGPLGWLGRLLGITMQPALPAPPFPHGQFLPPGPVPQPNAPNGGWPANHSRGILSIPTSSSSPSTATVAASPIFRGFYGPAGWQPWVPEALVNVPPQQQPGHPPQEPSPQSGSVPPSAATSSTPAEIGRAPVAQPQHASSLAAPTSTMTGDASAAPGPRPTSESESLSTPRDAAALAASRRLNSSPAARAPAGGPSVRSDNDAAEGSSNGSGSTHSSFSTTSTESSPSAATAVNAPLPTPTTSARPDLPPLIPLYDTGNPNPPRVANAPSGVLPYSYGNATAIPRAPYYRGPSGSNSRPYAGPPQPHSHPQTAMYGPTWPEAPQPTRYTRVWNPGSSSTTIAAATDPH
ncbi:ERAD-associated E3 ubiquitin-protein ligase HRD1 [Grifola frondosa]|uniref:ERAD-associated E3 ubiquitin-protein ligase HRD1 n=1 Tax=Grifola frondosa TaxID=5627 RepID=A0A1C7LPD1_GRIFR|nr:ERAD-associated E3 ubiquitin-protein ligase HRD1 [Grifola frondosa]